MDKELLEQLVPIVEKTKEGILRGVEIAQEQMPELIKEIYRWNFTISLIVFTVGVILLIISIAWIPYFAKRRNANVYAMWELGFAIPFIPLCIISTNFVWLKILIAPKLFLVEYISQLIK